MYWRRVEPPGRPAAYDALSVRLADGLDVEGPVQAELFVVWLNGGQLELTGPCGGSLNGCLDPVRRRPQGPAPPRGPQRDLDERTESSRDLQLGAPEGGDSLVVGSLDFGRVVEPPVKRVL